MESQRHSYACLIVFNRLNCFDASIKQNYLHGGFVEVILQCVMMTWVAYRANSKLTPTVY